jgi:hypothetical protein
MSSRTVNVRIPAPLFAELAAFCSAWRQPRSTVIRWAMRYFLTHQEQALEELGAHPEDPRSEEHRINGDRYLESLAHIDLEALVARELHA